MPHLAALITVTTNLLLPSTTLAAPLILVTIRFRTVLPLPLVVIHGLIMINLG
ncbi:hypothetical protein A2U01_0075734, partial [Trifolium medium]|nr:hypothetical protein [Trifolium medium]